MKTLGIAALAGIGIALLFGTEKGRGLMGQARDAMTRMPGQITDALDTSSPEKIIQQVLEEAHPDTAMAQAFQEAVAA
jgi:hypothetical protein